MGARAYFVSNLDERGSYAPASTVDFISPSGLVLSFLGERARCSRGASPCPLHPFDVTKDASRFCIVGAEAGVSSVCRTNNDARTHPVEPLILLRARLRPLSALQGRDPICIEPTPLVRA